MAAQSETPRPFQPLDLVFACHVCHVSMRDIPSPVPDEKGLDGVRKPAAKLWMTECAHLVCAKHLEGGAPPFHPAGQAPRTVCPVCATRQNNHALKQIYAISGFNKGEYDDNIPHHFFQCPPVAIDAKDSAMDALRFQFLGLVSYGIAAATKYRSLQTAHSHLKGQVDELRMQRTEAETNVHTMTERIAFLEGEDRKHKSRQPEITHYLRQFPRLKSDLEQANDHLRRHGHVIPPVDCTMPPPELYENSTAGRRRTNSSTRQGGRLDRDETNASTLETQIPSVSSITLRGNSSRTYINDDDDDHQRSASKRQKLSSFKYKPHHTVHDSFEKTHGQKPFRVMPPPRSSIAQETSSRSKHFQPAPNFYQDEGTQSISVNERFDTDKNRAIESMPQIGSHQRGYTEASTRARLISDDEHYMSGALQADHYTNPEDSHRQTQPKRMIRPVDDFNDVSRLDYAVSARPQIDATPSLRIVTENVSRQNLSHKSPGPREPYKTFSENWMSPQRSGVGHYHQQTSRRSQIHSDHPTGPQGSSYGERHGRKDVFRLPAGQRSNRPHTPSPQKLDMLRQSESLSVTSPFFRADQRSEYSFRRHPASTFMAAPVAHEAVNFRMAPPRRRVQTGSIYQPQTMNSFSSTQDLHADPENGFTGFDRGLAERHRESFRAPRDSSGYFVRPVVYTNSMSAAPPRNETAYQGRYYNQPRPLPSSTPSLASSINMAQSRRAPAYDGALANIRGVKGASTCTRGMPVELFGSRSGEFSRAGRPSIRR